MTHIAFALTPVFAGDRNKVTHERFAGDRDNNARLLNLIRRIADGDHQALGELYDATSRQVFGVAKRILRDDSDTEEATMAVYLEVWRRAKSYDLQRGLPLAWLLMMARSRAIDRLRARRSDRYVQADAPATPELAQSDPESAMLEAQQGEMIRAAVQSLSPDQRQVIELTFFSGLTNQEIADRLTIPLGTVKGRIRLALQHLRNRLRPAAEKGWL
ncbi:MAG: RNA polymerase subunit sigma-70 [Chloracidobacterium sp. CP2_5A]|nr:MAG: RNA polymerase subunit sigma-70 [Chloracidobacterium sp. CP2_5A]